jgi:hypothetical protein
MVLCEGRRRSRCSGSALRRQHVQQRCGLHGRACHGAKFCDFLEKEDAPALLKRWKHDAKTSGFFDLLGGARPAGTSCAGPSFACGCHPCSDDVWPLAAVPRLAPAIATMVCGLLAVATSGAPAVPALLVTPVSLGLAGGGGEGALALAIPIAPVVRSPPVHIESEEVVAAPGTSVLWFRTLVCTQLAAAIFAEGCGRLVLATSVAPAVHAPLAHRC